MRVVIHGNHRRKRCSEHQDVVAQVYQPAMQLCNRPNNELFAHAQLDVHVYTSSNKFNLHEFQGKKSHPPKQT
jgi:hypothetical protein